MFFNLLSLTVIISSILFAYSSNSWIQMWMALEINMLAFIPLIYNQSSQSIMAMFKYFFIQATASSLFLLSIILTMNLNMNLSYMVILFSMLTKLGMFPIFSWFPQIAASMTWLKNIILMTAQKMIPLSIITMINSQNFIKFSVTMTLLVSLVGMWTQNSLKKIMAYSSMAHLSWMSISIISKTLSWMMYLMIYTILTMIIFYFFHSNMLSSLSQLSTIHNYSLKFNSTVMLWSMGGLPPTLGFIPKWQMIMDFNSKLTVIMTILIFSSLFSIIIYTYMLYPSITSKMHHSNIKTQTPTLSLLMMTGMLPIISML